MQMLEVMFREKDVIQESVPGRKRTDAGFQQTESSSEMQTPQKVWLNLRGALE